MPKLDYTMYDADKHRYEPDDCFTRYLAGLPPDAVRKIVRENLLAVVAGGQETHIGAGKLR